MHEDLETYLADEMLSIRRAKIELYTKEFLWRLKPPIPDPITKDKIARREIELTFQGDTFWFTTHGSRASRKLDVSVYIGGINEW